MSSPESFGDSLLPGKASLLHAYCTVKALKKDVGPLLKTGATSRPNLRDASSNYSAFMIDDASVAWGD